MSNIWLCSQGAQPQLKSSGGPRIGSQHRGAKAGLGVGFFENSDAKYCILVTTCCEISCFLKTTATKLGDQYVVDPQPKFTKNTGETITWKAERVGVVTATKKVITFLRRIG